ncbi:MAG: peptidylprolyl isomerase [Piscirickettsiaceae bacterium CG_4_9_14_3_um_filter_43_564]|nr:peptidylprolyl isomerase [Thiomicrospira sp.]OIP93797.1 MAG: peptidylprolyl isomerase [Thiomicrospira sp. CG2_30_44_34]PIQ04392.1 MAG: peptidylprolyl isomerase [Piscirickettsiaceae bacterium CG18_big_fil_WC_8_21_14_2_50_44_103]PIU37801.1 MAG: peptidylprolyl isomerase [Piscirickettsiaceae bacterium CG07_land_8_20_14_0_80_44_28]PIW57404.1 MAG: peptidylprolyl isomerase [Piscirickettsiaceae bacterium CG12_big_fil_rev_8_21_14_0_65_44_934]PIW76842.1 MAG: peptidylprolyl isomerase [Piscirickettsiac
MKIETNKVGQIHYALTDADGNLIDASNENPLAYLHGHSNLIPGLEKQLEGKKVGDKFTASIAPEEGYGEIEAHLIQEGVPKSMFQGVENLEVGMRFEAQSEQGVHSVEITEVGDETVTVDGNHPLAGKTLNFEIEVMDIRDATEEELTHGHAHGDGGHHH